MEPVTVTYIRNVLNPLETREIHRLPALRDAREYVAEVVGDGIEGYEIVASVNGCEFLPGQMEGYVAAPGDSLAFCAVPQGSGGGKQIFMLVAMVALMIVAPYAGGALAAYAGGFEGVLTASEAMMYSTGTALAYAAGSGAVMIAGGLLMSALAPRPDTPVVEESKSPTYSWDNIGNSVREGATLPELFGSCRIAPPLIGSYIDTSGDKHFLNMLFAVAGHRVDSIDIASIRINGKPITDFAGVSAEERLGEDTQAVMQNFKDSHSDVTVQIPMKAFQIIERRGDQPGEGHRAESYLLERRDHLHRRCCRGDRIAREREHLHGRFRVGGYVPAFGDRWDGMGRVYARGVRREVGSRADLGGLRRDHHRDLLPEGHLVREG